MNRKSKAERLIAILDELIEKHGPTNPELFKDLVALRKELVEANDRRRLGTVALVALRIAALAKFLHDIWPPDEP